MDGDARVAEFICNAIWNGFLASVQRKARLVRLLPTDAQPMALIQTTAPAMPMDMQARGSFLRPWPWPKRES